MEKKVSGLIVAPMWRAFMDEVLKVTPTENFNKPQTEDSYDLKPVLRGKWQGGISSVVTNGGQTDIPYNSVQEILSGGVHSILYWLDKDNPRGNSEIIPENDPQFERWEYPIRLWATSQGLQ
jgi:membrane carboxypeptidase/penicillin-binding protein